VSTFTYRNIIILMGTIKDPLYRSAAAAMGDLSLAVQMRPARHIHDDVPAWQRAAGTTPTALSRDSVTLDDLIFGAATRRTVRCAPVAVDTASHCR
jgi:hypothetical protein